MAGRQFATPRPVFPSRPRRRFTLAQANKTLPLVKRIVADIVRCHNEAAELQMRLATTSSMKHQRAIQKDLDGTLEHLQGYVEELTEIGCELKDYQTGLIDFIGRHQHRDVCLCWRLGEELIDYWHEMDAGLAGRQPASLLEEDA
jgi:hypothetical protein